MEIVKLKGNRKNNFDVRQENSKRKVLNIFFRLVKRYLQCC